MGHEEQGIFRHTKSGLRAPSRQLISIEGVHHGAFQIQLRLNQQHSGVPYSSETLRVVNQARAELELTSTSNLTIGKVGQKRFVSAVTIHIMLPHLVRWNFHVTRPGINVSMVTHSLSPTDLKPRDDSGPVLAALLSRAFSKLSQNQVTSDWVRLHCVKRTALLQDREQWKL